MIYFYLASTTTETATNQMQSASLQRKSALALSLSIDFPIEEQLETIWPDLSFTESAKKRSRSSSKSSECKSPTAIEDSDSDNREVASLTCRAEEIGYMLQLSKLRRSTSLCSPFVGKEHKGAEEWRDLL